MKAAKIIFFFLIISSNLFGQNDFCLIFGSWEREFYLADSNSTFTRCNSEFLTIYDNFQCQYNRINWSKDSLIKNNNFETNTIEVGDWDPKNNGKRIKIKNLKQMPSGFNLYDDKIFEFYIKSISDSSLTLCYFKKDTGECLHYKRVADIPIYEEKPKPVITQGVYLVSSIDTSKRFFLRTQDLKELYFKQYLNDSTKLINCSCYIESVQDSNLMCKISAESMEVSSKNFNSRIRNDYSTFDYWDSKETRILNIRKIDYIYYSSNRRNSIYGIFGVIVGVSAFTTMFIAPLASINYKTGKFNSKRYYNLAGAGLFGLTIGIPISRLSQPKQYFISIKGQKKDKKYWYFDN